ncbi:alpha/beta hydrolase, partial [Mycobacterium simiae]
LAEKGFRVLYYDAFGHGRSDRPAIRYRLDVFIRQLDQLTAKLGIDAMHLIGWSLGAAISTAFAAQHPGRVSSLTLISPALFMSRSRMSQMLLRVPGSSALVARRIGRIADRVDFDLSRPERFPDLAARVREQMSFPGFQRAVASALVNFPRTPPRRWIAAGQHVRPVLVVWGDDDPVTPIAAAAQVLAVFPRATLRRIKGARHAAHLDHAEIVHPAIIDHLNDCA